MFEKVRYVLFLFSNEKISLYSIARKLQNIQLKYNVFQCIPNVKFNFNWHPVFLFAISENSFVVDGHSLFEDYEVIDVLKHVFVWT